MLFRSLYSDPVHRDRQFLPSLSGDGQTLIVAVGEGEVGDKGLEDVLLMEVRSRTWAPMSTGFKAAFVYAGSDRGELYFVTTDHAPNGRVIAVDPAHPEEKHWRQVVAESSATLTVSEPVVSVVGHRLFVRTIIDAHSAVTVYGLDGALLHTIRLPGQGTVRGFAGHAEDSQTHYGYTDPLTPFTVYRYEIGRAHV